MANIYAPVMRALVVVALVLATATLMFVAVNTARACPAAGNPSRVIQIIDIQRKFAGLARSHLLL